MNWDFVVSDTQPPKGLRAVHVALTKTKDTKEIQRLFYTY